MEKIDGKIIILIYYIVDLQIGEMERNARDELSDLKESIGQAKQKLEGDRLAESMEIARLKVQYFLKMI